MIVDTHCHLHFPAFDADRDEVLRRASEAGVRYLVNVGTDPVNNEAAYQLARSRAGMFHTAGLHPHSAHEIPSEGIDAIAEFTRKTRPVAIGEIGLDYFKSEADPEVQKKVFARMIGIAMENSLPVVVHSRNAWEDTHAMLRAEGGGKLRGVMHCFSYEGGALEQALDLGFFISFTANITYKSAAGLLEVARRVPLERLLIETDAPYLAPQKHRGGRNEPSYLAVLADFLAAARGIGRQELEAATTSNALRAFGLPALS